MRKYSTINPAIQNTNVSFNIVNANQFTGSFSGSGENISNIKWSGGSDTPSSPDSNNNYSGSFIGTFSGSSVDTNTLVVNNTSSLNEIILNPNSIPTSSLGLSIGQLYRTGSNFDEIKINLIAS